MSNLDFDDFLGLTFAHLSTHTDMCISALFHLLGWALSKDKLVPFGECCKALGVELDLTKSPSGTVSVPNTQRRCDELISLLQAVVDSRSLSRSDAERLRGRLQFASNQLFSRRFKSCLKEVNTHVSRGFKMVTENFSAALTLMIEMRRPIILGLLT